MTVMPSHAAARAHLVGKCPITRAPECGRLTAPKRRVPATGQGARTGLGLSGRSSAFAGQDDGGVSRPVPEEATG